MNQQEQQAFLLSTFREEIDGHVVNLTRELVEIEEVGASPEQAEKIREAMRILHTIKGASRMMGFPLITKVAHVMEELIGNYRDRNPPIELPRNHIDIAFEGIDVISELTREVTRMSAGPAEPSALTSPEVIEILISKMAVMAGKPELAHPEVKDKNSASAYGQELAAVAPTAPTVASSPDSDLIFKTGSENAPVPPNFKVVQGEATAVENRTDRAGEETIRVRLDKLDDLINLAGELVINKQQNEEHLLELQDFLREFRTRTRMAQQLRDYIIERTPVEERSRLLGITELFSFEKPEMPEWIKVEKAAQEKDGISLPLRTTNGNGHGAVVVVNNGGVKHYQNEVFGLDAQGLRKVFTKLEDMINLDKQLEQRVTGVIRERKSYNVRFGAAADELRRSMLGIRMLPLETIFTRFARPVRDLAYERGKEVKLVIDGGSIEVDKRILEQIADPLIHMLRNSVDHGIEPPQERVSRGKPAEGTLKLSAMQKGSHVLIQVEDDGGGIAPESLRQAAVTKGYMDATTAAALSDEAVLDLIYRPGFSTRARPDEVSGRGIGMDVVQQNIKRLNGRMVVQNLPGRGVIFTMEIPLTLATVDALIIRCAGQLFALPSVMVAGTHQFSHKELQKIEGRPVIRLRGQLVPIVGLSEVLALSPLDEDVPDTTEEEISYGVLLSVGAGANAVNDLSERLICFEVDALVDEREVVVKGLSSFLEKTPNIAGVTVLGADGLALILDVFGLVQSARLGSVAPMEMAIPAPRDANPTALLSRKTYRILVVDDSLATRELERSILETAGFKVDTARDGVEALKVCRERRPDLVLSDVEMPNMDGFRLSAAIRNDMQLHDLPVIIVSSRDSEEDRRKGMEAGAQAYIIKGQFEQNKLLETISRLIV